MLCTYVKISFIKDEYCRFWELKQKLFHLLTSRKWPLFHQFRLMQSLRILCKRNSLVWTRRAFLSLLFAYDANKVSHVMRSTAIQRMSERWHIQFVPVYFCAVSHFLLPLNYAIVSHLSGFREAFSNARTHTHTPCSMVAYIVLSGF